MSSSVFDLFTTRDLLVVFGVLGVSAILYQLFFRPLLFSPLRKVPGPPFGHVLYGQFKNIIQAEAGVLQMEWAEKYGPTVRAVGPFGLERMIFVNASALQRILVSEWINYPRPDFMKNILGLAAGYGLLTVTGNEHKMMRRAMNPAFSLSNLMAQTDMYYPPLEGLVRILNQHIVSQAAPEDGKQILIYDWMSKVTLDVICVTAFGYHPDSVHNDNNELASAYHQLLDLQSGPNVAALIAFMTLIPGFDRFLRTKFAYKYRKYLFRGPRISLLQPLVESVHRIMGVSRQMLDEKLREADVKDSQTKKDIMSLLVRARMNDTEDGYKMSDQDLMEQVLTFLGAGHETTASGISWTLWLLATNPKYQERLRAEVIPVIEANPRPDYRTLKDLQLLDGVIMESLRLLPPVPMTFRKVAKDDWVDGNFLPKGTLLYIPIRVVNTYTEIWGPNAKEFCPERWSNLPSTYNSTFSLLSFITGPHSCIGRTMAIMEMKAIIAVIIAHFVFEPAYEGQVAKPTAAVTMKPEDNLLLRVKAVGKLPIPL